MVPAKSAKPVVLLDTNFLIAPLEFRIDVFSQLRDLFDGHVELVVLSAIEHELEALSKSRTPKGRAALTVLSHLTALGIPVIEDEETANRKPDDSLLMYAKRTGAFIASSDKDLRYKAKSVGIPVFAIQGQKRVVRA